MFFAVGASRNLLAAIFGPTCIAVQNEAAGAPFQIHYSIFSLPHFGLVGLGGAEAPPC